MLENLKEGQKITIIKPNELIPTRIYGTLKGYYISKYAQYQNSIHLFIKPFRCRRIERIIIHQYDTAFILKGNYEEAWRREEINSTTSQLHRLTSKDFDPTKVIYSHEYGEEIKANTNFETFCDLTCSCLDKLDIRGNEAIESSEYIGYIKELLKKFNSSLMLEKCKIENYNILEECIIKARMSLEKN